MLSLVFSTLKKCPKLPSFFIRYKSPPSYNFCDDEPHFFCLYIYHNPGTMYCLVRLVFEKKCFYSTYICNVRNLTLLKTPSVLNYPPYLLRWAQTRVVCWSHTTNGLSSWPSEAAMFFIQKMKKTTLKFQAKKK